MDGVAAKVAEEVIVLFQHCDRDPGARQQVTQHDAGGSAADNATGGFQSLVWHDSNPLPVRAAPMITRLLDWNAAGYKRVAG
jgi:hypothetical protein